MQNWLVHLDNQANNHPIPRHSNHHLIIKRFINPSLYYKTHIGVFRSKKSRKIAWWKWKSKQKPEFWLRFSVEVFWLDRKISFVKWVMTIHFQVKGKKCYWHTLSFQLNWNTESRSLLMNRTKHGGLYRPPWTKAKAKHSWIKTSLPNLVGHQGL